MNKLTAEVARRHQRDLKSFQENPKIGLSLKEELYLQALEIALPILEQQERGKSGWIDWNGNNVPFSNETVDVKYKSGFIDSHRLALLVDWSDDDIIAYRIIPEQPTNQNGEQ